MRLVPPQYVKPYVKRGKNDRLMPDKADAKPFNGCSPRLTGRDERVGIDIATAEGRRTEAREKLDAALGAMHRVASTPVLTADPLSEQLRALAESVGAFGEIYEASADTQLEIAERLRTQADAVANDAIERAAPPFRSPGGAMWASGARRAVKDVPLQRLRSRLTRHPSIK